MNWKGIIGAGITALTGFILYKIVEEQYDLFVDATGNDRPNQNVAKNSRKNNRSTQNGHSANRDINADRQLHGLGGLDSDYNDVFNPYVSDSPCVNYIPPQAKEGFFSLDHNIQIGELISRVKEGTVSEIFNAINLTWDAIGSDNEEKKAERARNYTLELLVELLELKDDRMMDETADILTTISVKNEADTFDGECSSKNVDGPENLENDKDSQGMESSTADENLEVLRETEEVNCRVDDTDFKESLLYIIRDRMDADHPLIDRVIAAYYNEPGSYNRYRIVRAVGIIGGEKANSFLESVVEDEAAENSFAYQVARKYLK